MEIKIKALEINATEIAEYFTDKINGIEPDGDKTEPFHFIYEGENELNIDCLGRFSREYEYHSGDWFTPGFAKQTGQAVYDLDLLGFIDGEKIEITNANEICSIIETNTTK